MLHWQFGRDSKNTLDEDSPGPELFLHPFKVVLETPGYFDGSLELFGHGTSASSSLEIFFAPLQLDSSWEMIENYQLFMLPISRAASVINIGHISATVSDYLVSFVSHSVIQYLTDNVSATACICFLGLPAT